MDTMALGEVELRLYIYVSLTPEPGIGNAQLVKEAKQ